MSNTKVQEKPNHIDKFASKKVKELRLAHDMTQEQLGSAINKSSVVISHIESGRTVLNLGDVLKIAKVFDVPTTVFFPPDAVMREREVSDEEFELIILFRKIENRKSKKLAIENIRNLVKLATEARQRIKSQVK